MAFKFKITDALTNADPDQFEDYFIPYSKGQGIAASYFGFHLVPGTLWEKIRDGGFRCDDGKGGGGMYLLKEKPWEGSTPLHGIYNDAQKFNTWLESTVRESFSEHGFQARIANWRNQTGLVCLVVQYVSKRVKDGVKPIASRAGVMLPQRMIEMADPDEIDGKYYLKKKDNLIDIPYGFWLIPIPKPGGGASPTAAQVTQAAEKTVDVKQDVAKKTIEGPDAAGWYKLGKEGGGTVGGTKYDEKACCEKSLELDPANAEGWFELGSDQGRAREEPGGYGGGTVGGTKYCRKACYEKSLELDPRRADGWYQLGYKGGGMVGGKEYGTNACYEKCLELDPAHVNGWRFLGYSSYGGTVGGKKYSEKACYEQCLELDPAHASGWYRLGTQWGGTVRGKWYSKDECREMYELLDGKGEEERSKIFAQRHAAK